MEVAVRNAIMHTSVGKRSQMAASDRAGAEIWSGSVEQVSSLMWSHSPLALSQDMAGGAMRPANPFPGSARARLRQRIAVD
jgi:hypothetical protein